MPSNSATNLKSVSLALSDKSVDFSKVILMIDEMGTLLKAEQGGDDSGKARCIKSFDRTEDEAKVLARQIAGHAKLDDGATTWQCTARPLWWHLKITSVRTCSCQVSG